jgi:hypothetical protein
MNRFERGRGHLLPRGRALDLHAPPHALLVAPEFEKILPQ